MHGPVAAVPVSFQDTVRGGTSLMEPVGLSCPSGSVRRQAMEEILRAERYQATAYAP